jgi:FAD/FMN-containing dehydrogenase
MNKQLENEIRVAYPDGLTWQKSIPTFHPESEEQAADIFRLAGEHKQKLYISGFNNNVNPVGDPFSELLIIKTDRMNAIISVAPQDFYITVGAGYPLMELSRALDKHELFFPFSDAGYPGSCGGALASGLTGSDGDHTIPLSRYLLSVTAALPDGTIVKPGAVTFKSVSGYDVARIFFNSWGVIGMVLELSFRVLPESKRDDMQTLTLFAPDRRTFSNQMRGDSPLATICQKIKAEYDPHNLLPIF